MQKLRELDALKTEFVHSVSHELKTPLTAILGGLELLRLDAGRLEPQHREIVDLIAQGAQRLQYLISDILSTSRLEKGVVELALQPVSLQEAVHEMLVCLPEPVRRRVRLEVSGRPRPAAADPLKLKEVLENLVSNALKYSDESKSVCIRLSEAEAMVRVEVIDWGMGIRAKDRRHLFERFYRSEDARLAGKEGTGLGLAIAQELARLQHGRLSYRSRWKRGTTFLLQLPRWKGDHDDR
jgi:signal transduction histidine kinase